jgi:hypothetical protein
MMRSVLKIEKVEKVKLEFNWRGELRKGDLKMMNWNFLQGAPSQAGRQGGLREI